MGNLQYKDYSIILYDRKLEDLVDLILLKLPICRYAMIEHTKDINENGELKKPHIHLVLMFDEKVYLPKIAKVFGVEKNLVEVIYNSIGALRYLIHLDNDDKEKYDIADVVTNIPQFDKYISNFDKDCYVLQYFYELLDNAFNLDMPITLQYITTSMYDKGLGSYFVKKFYMYKCLFNEYVTIHHIAIMPI